MKINVGVIYGSESVEHEVSVISALQAMKALNSEKYNVIPLYITKNRVLYSGSELLEVSNYKDMNSLLAKAKQVYLSYDGNKTLLRPVKQGLFKNEETSIDVVLPVIHGTNGEDGTVQGYLEMMHVPYSGCDVIAAGVGQDKIIMKYVLEGYGLPIVDWFWIYGHKASELEKDIKAKAKKIGYPLILKPACAGSSVGIEIAHNEDELMEKISEVTKFDRKVLIEKVIDPMTEINCSVLGDCYKCQASTLEQVFKKEEILSFADKYGSNNSKGAKSKGMASTSRLVPAPIGEEKTKLIQDLAIKTFLALGSSGVCRIDFLMNSKTKEVWVNEINTIPGSLAFYLWEESGMKFEELMDSLVKQAIDRQRRREKMTFSYETNILSGFVSGGVKGKTKGQ